MGPAQHNYHQKSISLISSDGIEKVVPFEITNMCRKIPQNIKTTPEGKLMMHTDVKALHLSIIVSYCQMKFFNKNNSGIPFPLSCNKLVDNMINAEECNLIQDYLEDFDQLKELMKTGKSLGCEPFYQLAAAAIASWFRRRSIRDVINELSMD